MSPSEPTSPGYRPTTTHAAWGAGHPRLLVTSEHYRFVHEVTADLTHVGSADGSELLLHGADPVHATITHDLSDEYVLEMRGKGDTTHGTDATLRTGAQFTAGPWRLVYARDEYADHGRPYGGRNGGEGAHQRRQDPRPDYAHDRAAVSPPRCEVKESGEVSDPAQLREIRRSVLVDATADTATDRAIDVRVVNDVQTGIYEVHVGDRVTGGMTYNLIGDSRIVLLAVSVFPDFRGKGIATELIRTVLDDVRAQGRSVTNYCPVVAAFIDDNPAYADLIDDAHPGVSGVRRAGHDV